MLEDWGFQQSNFLWALLCPLVWLWSKKLRVLGLPSWFKNSDMFYPMLDLLGEQRTENSRVKESINWPLSTIFCLLIISLAQPISYGDVINEGVQPEPVDLILVVSTDVSMVLRDYQLNGEQLDRMQMTQLWLQKLVRDFKGRRLALVVLGHPPAIWLPLTSDKYLLEDAIGRLDIALGGRNTDLGETIFLVKEAFLNEDLAIHREVLLVNSGYLMLGANSPESAIKPFVKAGFRLHTLAMGAAKKPDFSLGKGHLIYQSANIKGMQRLAHLGQGQMVHVKDLTSVDDVLSNISVNSVNGSAKSAQRVIEVYYHYPLLLAFFMLCFELFPLSRWLGRKS